MIPVPLAVRADQARSSNYRRLLPATQANVSRLAEHEHAVAAIGIFTCAVNDLSGNDSELQVDFIGEPGISFCMIIPILVSGVLGIIIITVMISALRLSYAVEARSDPRKAKRLFGYTNVMAVALNIGVAKDTETQALRSKILKHLAVIAILFAVMAVSGPLLRNASG
jgi:hypothetical protein